MSDQPSQEEKDIRAKAEFESEPLSGPAPSVLPATLNEAELRAALVRSREEVQRLTAELSLERRTHLRLQRELEEQITALERELLQSRRPHDAEPPRHSWVVRRDGESPAEKQSADTVRPPPTVRKRDR